MQAKTGKCLSDSTFAILPTDIYFMMVMLQMAPFFGFFFSMRTTPAKVYRILKEIQIR